MSSFYLLRLNVLMDAWILREDLRGPVLGSPLGGLTRNNSGSATQHGDGTAGRTATFLNVVVLVAGSPLGGLIRNNSGSAPRHGDGTASRTATFLNVVLLLAPFERAHGCLDFAWRSAWSCTGLSSRRTDPKQLRLRPLTRRRNSRQNSDVFKCRPLTCSAWTCLWKHGSAWSCAGLFSRRTDPKPNPRHGDGSAGRTATFINVVLLLVLPERVGENVDLRKDLWILFQIWNLLSDGWPETCPTEWRF
jgi:hypothetical protein